MRRATFIRSRAGAPMRAVLFAVLSLCLAACGLSGPAPTDYVLGAAPAATPSTVPQTSMPVVVVRRVLLPDYLDTTDLVMRKGGVVVSSPTGRWAERLSVGVTRSLVAALSTRLPGLVVTAASPVGRPAREVRVDLASFESQGDGRVVLVARWVLTDGGGKTLVAQQVSLVEPLTGAGDGAVVAAMTRAVDDLAARIAAGIERASPLADSAG